MIAGQPPPLRYSANLSMLFRDLPVNRRPMAAARAGFDYVESWWPFSAPAPSAGELEGFLSALAAADVQLVALNLDAGDPAAGERGLLALPALGQRVHDNLEAVICILESTGCRIVNALYGNRHESVEPSLADSTALRRLARAADSVADVGATVVLETLNLSDSPAFPLTDIEVTADVVERVNELTIHHNVGLLLDTYHLQTMGTDPATAIRRFSSLIRHVQFADAPGRGRPGTGAVDFLAVEQALRDVGYDGFVGLEYDPDTLSAGATRPSGRDREEERHEDR